ncbi:interferon alpha/beta receptor 1a isoform X1 [Astyanax mexicanus]|uniref:interferon alpha/beta receptor 1a isoform X1 n=1 Tax=Astyanax mexicanus TaxID=7994 RepID=UPI0020CB2F30|nr:interferon alpha/beta receptor 1a isoform X1 [Astyanax mexicanus]
MLLYLHVGLYLLIFCSVSTSLPSPYDVKMVAVDLNYTLWWAWRGTHLNHPVNFTSDYALWRDDGSYKLVCKGSGQLWCDFTNKLNFRGTYQIRVRAEDKNLHSNWTYLRFTPDEDVLLGPPSRVDIRVHRDIIILIISESIMSSKMVLKYHVLYWEQLKPEQKMLKVFENCHASLTALKLWTEYCVQVSLYSQDYNTGSNFTSPQCVSTTGQYLAWQIGLAVLCGILVLVVLAAMMFLRFRRKLGEYKPPDSILGLPFDHPPLLEAQEMSCEVACVTAPSPHLVPDTTAELQSGCSQWSGGSEQDSGIGSGEESC